MSNLIANWWRSRQFHSALKQGNSRLAEQLLQDIENSGARLSWLEKLFRDKLQSVQSAHQFKRDAVTISGRLKQNRRTKARSISPAWEHYTKT